MKAAISRTVTIVTTSVTTVKTTTRDTETHHAQLDSVNDLDNDWREASLCDWEKRTCIAEVAEPYPD